MFEMKICTDDRELASAIGNALAGAPPEPQAASFKAPVSGEMIGVIMRVDGLPTGYDMAGEPFDWPLGHSDLDVDPLEELQSTAVNDGEFLHRLEDCDLDVHVLTPLSTEQHAALPDDIKALHAGPILDREVPGKTLDELDKEPNAPVDARVDGNLVPFDGLYCAKAEKPFYASGKKSGQWKRRGGVDEAQYDEWYAAELAKIEKPAATGGEQERVDTGAAFSGGTTTPETQAPTDLGSLMGWIAEQQAAGNLTQAVIDAAWQKCGLTVVDLCPPNAPEDVATNIGQIYAELSGQ